MKKLLIILAICVSTFNLSFESEIFKVYILSDTLSFEEGNAAYVNICVQNISGKNAFFKIYPADYSTFQPVVYTMEGREETVKVKYRLAGKTVDQVCLPLVPREIELAPDEKFHRKINLNDYYNLVPGKKYKIRAFFMPDAKVASVIRSENTLMANFNKHIEKIALPSEVNQKTEIEPSEIVALFIKAEKDKRWNNMLKYLDLEKYINVYPDYAQAYNGADDLSRRSVMKDFISYLSSPRRDYVLDYEIINEKILDEGNSALVTVNIRRHGSIMPFAYEYRFSLERNGAMWKISSSDATIKKDKKR